VFDSHCHLHDARVGDAAEAEILRARAAGVEGFLLAGVGPDGWPDQERLARAHPDLFVAYGVHPQLIDELDDAETDRAVLALSETLASPSRVRAVAVGEIGLDGVGARRATLERQAGAFRRQLAESRAKDLPVVLHILQAHGRALEILKADGVPHAGGVVHSYSGSAELVRDYVGLGLSISFAGAITEANARKTHEAARVVPAERLLVETDAPFQTPRPFRPARNEPAFLVAIVDALAQIRGEAKAELARSTAENARRLFGLS
jgi:TatD DNase family protein